MTGGGMRRCAVADGSAARSGYVPHRNGGLDLAGNMTANTLRYFASFQPERVVMWCPSCIYFYDEVVQAEVPYKVQHVSEYLLEHLDAFRIVRPVPKRVALH